MKVLRVVAEVYTWMANGQAYASQAKYPIALAIAFKVWFPTANILSLGILALFALTIMTFIGWFDLRFIQLHQELAQIQTEKYNPYFRNLKKRFK